jgi:hypothetical protein
MLLPSLLLILSAARLIGLLLRASTSTAQSVTISFTTRARRASTRRPTAFVFPLPACAPGARERCSVSFRSYSGVRVQIKQPLPLFLPCAALREHGSVMRSARFLLAPQEPRDRNPYSQGVTGFRETLALRLSRSTDRSIWAHPIPAKDVPPRFSVNSIVRCPDPEVVHCA